MSTRTPRASAIAAKEALAAQKAAAKPRGPKAGSEAAKRVGVTRAANDALKNVLGVSQSANVSELFPAWFLSAHLRRSRGKGGALGFGGRRGVVPNRSLHMLSYITPHPRLFFPQVTSPPGSRRKRGSSYRQSNVYNLRHAVSDRNATLYEARAAHYARGPVHDAVIDCLKDVADLDDVDQVEVFKRLIVAVRGGQPSAGVGGEGEDEKARIKKRTRAKKESGKCSDAVLMQRQGLIERETGHDIEGMYENGYINRFQHRPRPPAPPPSAPR